MEHPQDRLGAISHLLLVVDVVMYVKVKVKTNEITSESDVRASWERGGGNEKEKKIENSIKFDIITEQRRAPAASPPAENISSNELGARYGGGELITRSITKMWNKPYRVVTSSQ